MSQPTKAKLKGHTTRRISEIMEKAAVAMNAATAIIKLLVAIIALYAALTHSR